VNIFFYFFLFLSDSDLIAESLIALVNQTAMKCWLWNNDKMQ